MNILLLAFAIPVATVLLAIVLQKVLKCPLLVAATFFAILLIVTYAAFDSSFLVLAILYTILAYVTAVITKLICDLINRFNLNCNSTRITRGVIPTTGSWSCTTRNLNTTGVNQLSTSELNNGEKTCTYSTNSNEENEPVVILTDTNNMTNNNSGTGNVRNGCNCRRN